VAGCNSDDDSEAEAPAETTRDVGASAEGFEAIPDVVRSVAPSVVAIESGPSRAAARSAG
jgi:hypothetical protein